MLLKSIEERQARFKKNREHLNRLLSKFKAKPQGKNVGLNIPDDIRVRVTEQVKIWKADSYRQLLHVCLVMGLGEIEEMGRIQKKAQESEPPPPNAPAPARTASIKEFISDLRNEVLVKKEQAQWPDDPVDDTSDIERPADDEDVR